MKFTYNNKEFKVDLSKFARRKKGKASKPHKELYDKLKEKYPMDIIIQEFPLPGTKPKLYADFFLPSKNIIYEIDGRQHKEYVPFFHKTKRNFFKAKARDNTKQDWCSQNDITLIRIDYDEWDGRI